MVKHMENKHGGKREGAGRPRLLEHAVKVLITLTKDHLTKLDRGRKAWSPPDRKGSRSEFVRKLIDDNL
jgi:hypothetical protein